MSAVYSAGIKSFHFADADQPALSGIELNLAAGSLTGIVGAAGSGKSTLAAVVAGLLPHHDQAHGFASGSADRLLAGVQLGEHRVQFTPTHSPRIDVAAWARRVGLLPQDARHYLSGVRETVGEELAFNLEHTGATRADMTDAVAATAAELGLEHLLDARADQLSGGQERLVAIGALTVARPDVVVLDEPLAGLDSRAQRAVTDLVARLRADGRAVVVLSNTLDQLVTAADTVLVLDGGRATARWAPAEGAGALQCAARSAGVVVEEGAAGATQRGAQGVVQNVEPAVVGAGAALLQLAGATVRYPGAAEPAVTGLDLSVDAGECVALVGPNGVGKTSVLKAIAGLLEPEAGAIDAASVGLLLQNPADQLFARTVAREVSFGLPGKHRNPAVPVVLERVGLAQVAQEHPAELPGSQQRLVALASVLVREPTVLLLDEPTVSLDGPARAALARVIRQVRAAGGAVLMSTHDAHFAAAHADRVVGLGTDERA